MIKQGMGVFLIIFGALSAIGAGLMTMAAMWNRSRVARLRGRHAVGHSPVTLSGGISARTWLLMIGAVSFLFGWAIFIG